MFPSRNRILLVAAVLLSGSACDVGISSNLPKVFDDRIVGDWRGPKDLGKGSRKLETFHVRRAGDHYEFGDTEDMARNNGAKFSLAKAGDIFLIQEESDHPESASACGQFPEMPDTCRCLLGTAQISQDRCVFHMFNAMSLVLSGEQMPVKGMINQRNEKGVIVLRANGLPEFLARYLPSHPKSFKRPDTFVRVH